ncbi:hypothetical protein AJ87_20990 [Rhizobium yanglingense]|nr:hypothetical protein AJ87_20990 [Rhizobium yanglingense]
MYKIEGDSDMRHATVLPVSARSAPAFKANAAALQEFLLSAINYSKPDVVETMSRGRRHFKAFRGVIYEYEGGYGVYYGEAMMRLPEGQVQQISSGPFRGRECN